MDGILAAAATMAGVLLLAIGHHAFWTRRLRQPIRDDGVVRATTRDGWELALGTRRPSGGELRPPVLLVHGLSANRWTLDAGVDGVSLAAHLAAAGFRTFSLDLRGHGDSRRRPPGARPWSFDHYVEEDVPAALDAIRRETGAPRVLWVGHSLGAVTGMVACQLQADRIAGLVAIAGPMSFEPDGPVARWLGLGALVDGRFNRTLARMAAPWAGLVHPPAAQVAINGRNVEPAVLRRLLANGIEDVPGPVFRQLAGWVRDDVCRSADGARDYRAGLPACRQPALFVAAPADGLAPPSVVPPRRRGLGRSGDLRRVPPRRRPRRRLRPHRPARRAVRGGGGLPGRPRLARRPRRAGGGGAPVTALLAALLLAAPLACPPGSGPRGAAPPAGHEEWCEGPDKSGVPRRQGPARTWYGAGLVHVESTWRDGAQDGPWRELHRDGARATEGRYRAGERHGAWKWWREDGTLEEEVSYDMGRRHGRFVQWWRNGKRRTEGTFCWGVQCGRWVTWSESGSELGAVQYEEIRGTP